MLPVTAWKSQKQEHEAVDPTVRGQKEERGHWCPADFYSAQTLNPWNGAAHIQGRLSRLS